MHYSTADVPAEARHEDWSERGWPSVAAVFSSTPIGTFSTSADFVPLGALTVSYAEGTARRLDRSPDRIAADGIDALGVGILLEGEMVGSAAGRAFRIAAGEILLLDTAQPSEVSISVTRSIQLGVPRAMAIEAGLDLPNLHGLAIGAAAAAMLVSHVRRVREALPYLTPDEGPRVARTMLDMLLLAVNATQRGRPKAENPPPPSLAQRARNHIRDNLGSPALTVTNLCRRLKVSRSTLHRAFEAEGGVQAAIRTIRLDAARLALLDPETRERIGDLAERLGFSDAAHLSRLFRARFGETPSACRLRAGVPDDA